MPSYDSEHKKSGSSFGLKTQKRRKISTLFSVCQRIQSSIWVSYTTDLERFNREPGGHGHQMSQSSILVGGA